MDIFHGQDYVRKQFPVQAVEVTPLNIHQLAEACGGTVMHDGEKEGNFSRDYIEVPVKGHVISKDQTKARIGDFVVKQGRTFKVYRTKSFEHQFEPKAGSAVQSRPKQYKGKKPNRGPNPSQMPKKRTPDELRNINAQRAVERTETDRLKSEQAEFAQRAMAGEVEDVPAEVEGTPPEAIKQAVRKEDLVITQPNPVEAVLHEKADPSVGVHPVELVEGTIDVARKPLERGDSFSYDGSMTAAEAMKKVREELAEVEEEPKSFTGVPQDAQKLSDVVRKEASQLVSNGEPPQRPQLGDPELAARGLPQSFEEGHEPVYTDEMQAADQAAYDAHEKEIDEIKAAEKPKPITLDELNAQPGDDRTVADIHAEAIKKNPPSEV